MQVHGASSSSQSDRNANTAQRPGDILDKHDFLRLLTVQLRYQDPIDPVKDQDFIAQMAQFTSLEQIQNLTQKMDEFIDVQMTTSATSQAAALLGRTVAVFDPDTNESVVGVVDSVRFDLGLPLLVIGDKAYTLGDVYEMRTPDGEA